MSWKFCHVDEPRLTVSVWQEATTTAAETKEDGEPKEEEAVPMEDADQGKEKETPTTEAAGELPASAPASVA
jgi:hypothetical protein